MRGLPKVVVIACALSAVCVMPALAATGSNRLNTTVAAEGDGSSDCITYTTPPCQQYTYSFSGPSLGPSPTALGPGAFSMYITLLYYNGPPMCQVNIDDGHGDTLLAYNNSFSGGSCSVSEMANNPPTFGGAITADLVIVQGSTGTYSTLIGQFVHLSGTVTPMVNTLAASQYLVPDPSAAVKATIKGPFSH